MYMKLGNKNFTVVDIFYLDFSFGDPQDMREPKGSSLLLSFPPIHEHSNNFLQFSI